MSQGTPAAQLDEGVPGISLREVSKRYGSQDALLPVSLEIRDGEFFCLLGPSGCGKTTTLNLIGGFVAPTQGTIWIGGHRVDRLPPHKRNVNTVFQSYALFPHMTVGENVAFGLKMARVDKGESSRRALEALRLVGLEDFGARLPTQLSGGQQQRVAVARALVRRPTVLLLDEPLGALDLKLRKRLQVELSQIHREVGTTFVYVTHDQEEAMAMADRIAIMNAGRIEQVGTPSEIYRVPRSRFVADFIGESNFFDVTLDASAPGVAVLKDGSKVGCPNGGVTPGSKAATLMIRPESIHVVLPEAAPPGSLRATTVQTSFLGSYTRVAVRCEAVDDPVLVAVHGKGEIAVDALDIDKEVALWWRPDDAVLIEGAGQFEEGTGE
ncbi:MAG: ABC transporter ATP-binding protein [Actinobacteria bacterium]|nr:MAG: ABC transporter ATP-binding protein [Actinomycetota bacterium]